MKNVILSFIIIFFIAYFSKAQKADKLILHFAFNKSDITEITRHQLDSLLESNRSKYRIVGIELYAHCDSVGNHHYNDSLSTQRAIAVKNYLATNGINEAVFKKVSGLGKRKPLNHNATEEERFLNRRVELLVQKEQIEKDHAVQKELSPTEKKLKEIIADSATKEGSNLVLRNLNFEGGRHILLPQSEPILDELVEAMLNNPKLKIEIQGHVCCTPDSQDGRDNDLGTNDLSWQRAKVIYYYLIDKNISADRMSFRGFGGSQKLFPYERTPYEQEQNRRVELKIISK